MIKLQNVSKVYTLGEEKVFAAKDINIHIKEKEYVSLLGTSGSGKSTLMYMIGLLDLPSEGNIYIDGKDVSKLTDNELSKIRGEYIGFVFQSFNLINRFTVIENILLPTRYSKVLSTKDAVDKANELMQRFGIYERRNFYPNKISGGQQQRVAIARALIMNPKIILADEPTGNLDSKTGDEILDILEKLNKDLGVTVVLVTHEKEVAVRTRRQIFIKDGQVVKKY